MVQVSSMFVQQHPGSPSAPANFLSRIIWLSLVSTVASGSWISSAMWPISTRENGSISLHGGKSKEQ